MSNNEKRVKNLKIYGLYETLKGLKNYSRERGGAIVEEIVLWYFPSMWNDTVYNRLESILNIQNKVHKSIISGLRWR